MKERKTICKIITGSHLYGTSRPDSDTDYTGVFLPGMKDLLGLQNPPSEYSESVKKSAGERNTAGDIDAKFFNIKNFLKLAAEGQPGQLEMLFAPPQNIVQTSPEWQTILDNKHLLLSQKGIAPFLGFATAQAHKAVVKGENLALVRELLQWGKSLTSEQKSLRVFAAMSVYSGDTVQVGQSITVAYRPNEHGVKTLVIAGRQFDPGIKIADFLKSLDRMESRYGTRSDAAAQKGYDFKSLMHAYRLLDEAEEFLITGEITLPRPKAQADKLKLIRVGNAPVEGFDWFDDLMERIEDLRDHILPRSTLPKEPNWSKIDKLCQEILWTHLNTKTSITERLNAFFKRAPK